MKKIIALLIVASTFFVACDDVDTANVSSITTYPLITVKGDNPIFVPQGTAYVDQGAIATEAGAPIPFTSTASGDYRGGTSIDTNVFDQYSQVYTAANKDGFKASAVRTVIVYKTGDLVNSIEGVYTCNVSRNGSSPSTAKNIKYIYIWKNTNGTYQVSDAFGGWYQYHRGFGIDYITPGGTINAVNIATNTFTFPGNPLTNSGFGGTANITGLTVDPINKKIVLNCSWFLPPSTNHTFVATLTQVQL
jgi:hypothetical protein